MDNLILELIFWSILVIYVGTKVNQPKKTCKRQT